MVAKPAPCNHECNLSVEIKPNFFLCILPIDCVLITGCWNTFDIPPLSLGCIFDCLEHSYRIEDLLLEVNCYTVLEIDIVGNAHPHVALLEAERFLDILIVAVVHHAEVDAHGLACTVNDMEGIYASLVVAVIRAPRCIHEIDNPLLIGPILYVFRVALFVKPETESFVLETVLMHYVPLCKCLVSYVGTLTLDHLSVILVIVESHLVGKVIIIYLLTRRS